MTPQQSASTHLESAPAAPSRSTSRQSRRPQFTCYPAQAQLSSVIGRVASRLSGLGRTHERLRGAVAETLPPGHPGSSILGRRRRRVPARGSVSAGTTSGQEDPTHRSTAEQGERIITTLMAERDGVHTPRACGAGRLAGPRVGRLRSYARRPHPLVRMIASAHGGPSVPSSVPRSDLRLTFKMRRRCGASPVTPFSRVDHAA